MRFASISPLLLALVGLASVRATADEPVAPQSISNSANVVYVSGFAAISVLDEPGATVNLWAVAPDGEVVQIAQGTVGDSGIATVFAPDLGAGFLLVGPQGDIRDWLE